MKRSCKTPLSLFLILLLLFLTAIPCFSAEAPEPGASGTAEAQQTDGEPETEEPEDPAPPCLATGEHVFESYAFAGDGEHTAICVLCGEPFTFPCEYAETPDFVPTGNGAHADACLRCGGERIAPCSFTETTVRPTQTEGGYTEHVCGVCGFSYKDDPAPPEAERAESRLLGDVTNSGGVTAEDARAILRAAVSLEALADGDLPYADTDADGSISAADARIALRSSVGLETAVRHAYDTRVLTAPGCVTAGLLSFLCDYCGASGQTEIPAAGHAFGPAQTQAPTCTGTGKETAVCTVCGEIRKRTLPAAGHDFGAPAETPATCTQDGVSLRTCARCGYEEETVLPAKGHDLGDPVETPATCTRDGSILLKCTRCDYAETTPLPATGHSFGEPAVTAAACGKDGKSVITCKVCGETRTTVLPAKGHQWNQTSSTVACKVCGAAAAGWIALDGQSYYCVNGVKQKSWTGIGGSYYFFNRVNGRLAKSCTVDGLKLGADGKAVNTAYAQSKIKTLIKAKNIVAKITNPTDSLADKKLKCFRWVMKCPYKQYRLVGKSMKTKGWEMLFANDIFDHGNGCCGSTSCAFAFLAVEAGCSAVYVCDDGVSSGGHAWVTMEGNNKVYDVIFAKSKGFSANYNAYVKDYRRNPPRKTYIGG